MKMMQFMKCDYCGEENFINYLLSDTSINNTCKCGKRSSCGMGSEITIGTRILERSKYELRKNEDYNLSIVFSAMAFECELSNMYLKWRSVSKGISDQGLEESLRKFGTIKDKIQGLSKLMFSKRLEEFIQDDSDVCTAIENGFPSLCVTNLAKSFQEQLFWPRNRVLHLGYSGYINEDAKRCLNIAGLGLQIFDEMDKNKSNQMRKRI